MNSYGKEYHLFILAKSVFYQVLNAVSDGMFEIKCLIYR